MQLCLMKPPLIADMSTTSPSRLSQLSVCSHRETEVTSAGTSRLFAFLRILFLISGDIGKPASTLAGQLLPSPPFVFLSRRHAALTQRRPICYTATRQGTPDANCSVLNLLLNCHNCCGLRCRSKHTTQSTKILAPDSLTKLGWIH